MKKYTCSKGCGRQFVESVLAKHEKICVKVFQKKQKVFNTFQQRAALDGAKLTKINPKEIKQEKK